MAKIIDLPDGSEAEFPDTMSDADIKGVLAKKFPAPLKSRTVGNEMEAQAQDRPWETGIATAASKGVRGLGTLLLPKAAEKWAEGKGFLPTKQDIALLEQGTASSGKAQAANIGGEIALTALPGAGAYKAATSLPKIANTGRYLKSTIGGSAAGAAGSATMGEDPLVGAGTGLVLGPAGTAIADLGGAGVNLGKRLFQSTEQGAAKYLRELTDTPEADAKLLRGLRGLVPGEQTRAGVAATVDPRMLYMKELQEQAARRQGGRHVAVDQANEVARAAPLEQIAAPGQRTFNPITRKTDPSYAEEVRSRVTGPMYNEAMPDRVTLQPNVAQILRGAEVMPPAVKGGRQFAQEQSNAGVAGRAVPEGVTPYSAPPVPRDTSTGATMNPGGPFMPQVESQSIQELQLVRRALDDKIETAVRQGDMVTARRLRETRGQLSGEMEGQSGNFALANTTFKNLSEPQNQADVAQVLLNALRSPAGKERAASFMGAVQNAPQTIKRADLSPRFQNIGEVMTPEQMKDIGGVTASVLRQSKYEGLPRMELPRNLSPAEQLEGMTPGLLDKGITIAKKALSKMGVKTDIEVKAALDEAILDPNKMAALLETMPPSDRIALLSALREANPKGASIGIIAGQE